MANVVLIGAALAASLSTIANADSWQIETVDSIGAGRFTSLKVDRDNNLHLAYVAENGEHPLRYGFWDHRVKRWFFMTVENGASYCSLVLDSKQHPHISWADFGTVAGAKLRYAHWDGKGWQKEAIPLTSVTIAYYTSIALDAEDRPSISFYEYDGPRNTDFRVRLRNVKFNGKYWEVRTVDGDNQSGKFNDTVIDAQGRIHIFYANVNALTGSTRHAVWDGRSWNLEMVDDRDHNEGQLVGFSTCVVVDQAGNLHASYMNYSSNGVKYAVKKNNRWSVQTIDTVSSVGYPDRNSIAVDSAGNPYISYYDAGKGWLKLAHREGQMWVYEFVDENGSGFTSSLQIAGNAFWLSYSDETRGAVKVARRDMTASESASATAVLNGATSGVNHANQ